MQELKDCKTWQAVGVVCRAKLESIGWGSRPFGRAEEQSSKCVSGTACVILDTDRAGSRRDKHLSAAL